MILLDVSPGDEVMVSDFTFTGTVNPVLYLGATPVFIDCEMQTWNMDPDLLREAITARMKINRKPKAIIFVDIYGMPAKIDQLLAVAAEFDIPVIEDAAEALGSKYYGRHCGTFGEMGTLSFNGNKIITTSGGGALVSGNKEFTDRARHLASQAKENTLHFEHHEVGYNYRLSNVLAGIGRGQMDVIESRVAAHRSNNQRYRDMLAEIAGMTFQSEPDENFFSNYWLTSVVIDKPDVTFNSASVIRALGSDQIDSRPLMKPMHMQTVFQHHPAFLNGNSEFLFKNGLCLPSGSNLVEQDFKRIVHGIHAVRMKK
jgi:dTDP-4-amino-4,6-dideoxygalactose transaminase